MPTSTPSASTTGTRRICFWRIRSSTALSGSSGEHTVSERDMALETLVLAIGNDAVLSVDRPVKISRETVAELIEDCLRHASDDAALRRRYASAMTKFKERLVKLAPPSRAKAATREGYAQV